MKMQHIRPCALALLGALALTACGGNDDYAPVAVEDPAQVPASASASPMAFTAYVAARPANDTDEPLAVSSLMPPVSDTDEPSSVR